MRSRISCTAQRPLPSAVGTSSCETTAASDSESEIRTWFCSLAGNASMMRSIVLAALLVCSVPNTSMPISAAVIASAIVSRSRISPTSTTSASCRIAARSAGPKPCVCVPTSRCESTDFLFWCTNSTGSSIVTMCLL